MIKNDQKQRLEQNCISVEQKALLRSALLMKKEAIEAKNRGDLFAAKDFLTKAKLLDEKIQIFQRNSTKANSSTRIFSDNFSSQKGSYLNL